MKLRSFDYILVGVVAAIITTSFFAGFQRIHNKQDIERCQTGQNQLIKRLNTLETQVKQYEYRVNQLLITQDELSAAVLYMEYLIIGDSSQE